MSVSNASEPPGPPSTLGELEDRSSSLSHSNEALQLMRNFAGRLSSTSERQRTFGKTGVLVQDPIVCDEVRSRGLMKDDEDAFELLQGDVIGTSAAYFMGQRIENGQFIVATSTCDLVPGRRDHAALLRLRRIDSSQENPKGVLQAALRFSSTRDMYLPPLPRDHSDGDQTVLAYLGEFDGIASIGLSDALLADRQASLTLVGWRSFGSLVRNIVVRSTPGEERIRRSIDAASQP